MCCFDCDCISYFAWLMISVNLWKHLLQKEIVGGMTYIYSQVVYLDYVDESKFLLEDLTDFSSVEAFGH